MIQQELPLTKRRTLFMTGVTGTLGKEMVKHLLATTEDRLYVLVRRRQRFSHWDRMRKILAGSEFEKFLGTRLEVLEGDVTLSGFGLKDWELSRLRNEVTDFFHIAALTALNGSEEDCDRINVKGSEEALKFAWDFFKLGRMKRFFYFSTAYAAGSKQTFCSPEDSLPEAPAHANFYERSKYIAEGKMRAAMKDGLPVTIFRPSIVVGDSKTGEVSEFNVIYPFLKLFAHGILSLLPSRPENSFNIVPIDFVIKAAALISAQEDSIGKTFHLVTQEPPTIGTLLSLRSEYPDIPEIKMIAPEDFKRENLNGVEQMVFDMLDPYLGYLNDHLTFDTKNTQKALEGTGLEFPKTDADFLRTIVRYAVDAGYLVVG